MGFMTVQLGPVLLVPIGFQLYLRERDCLYGKIINEEAHSPLRPLGEYGMGEGRTCIIIHSY